MKLSDLAKKPQLVEMTLDDTDIVKEFGETITFWTWDRQPMESFLKLTNIDKNSTSSIFEAVKSLVLDENGKPVLDDEKTLPTKVLMAVVGKVVEGLGK